MSSWFRWSAQFIRNGSRRIVPAAMEIRGITGNSWPPPSGASIQIHGIEHLEKALSYNKGVLAFSAHLGNFTLIGLKMAAAGYPFHMLVKDPRYPAVAEAFHLLQKGQGGKFIYVEPWERALRQILSGLRKNEIVCILADEKKSKTGVIVDFFGHPAPTAPGPAVLALRTGAPLVPIFIARSNDGLQHIYIEPQLEINPNGDRSSDIPTVVRARSSKSSSSSLSRTRTTSSCRAASMIASPN